MADLLARVWSASVLYIVLTLLLSTVYGQVDTSLIDSDICAGFQDGVHAHPSDCHQYFHCLRGNTYVFRCFKGFVFHPSLKRCIFRSDCLPLNATAIDTNDVRSQNLELESTTRRRQKPTEPLLENDKQLKSSLLRDQPQVAPSNEATDGRSRRETTTTVEPPSSTLQLETTTQQTYLVRVVFSRRKQPEGGEVGDNKITSPSTTDDATKTSRRKDGAGEPVINGSPSVTQKTLTEVANYTTTTPSLTGINRTIDEGFTTTTTTTTVEDTQPPSEYVTSTLPDESVGDNATSSQLIDGNVTEPTTRPLTTELNLGANLSVGEVNLTNIDVEPLSVDAGLNVTITEESPDEGIFTVGLNETNEEIDNVTLIGNTSDGNFTESNTTAAAVTTTKPTPLVPQEAICNTTVVCSCPNSANSSSVVTSDDDPADDAKFSPQLQDYCLELRCVNGGMFVGLSNGHCGCVCPIGYQGPHCEHLSDQGHCNCANGGRCVLISNDTFTCQCPLGYIGGQCQYNVDDIQPKFAALINVPHQGQFGPGNLPADAKDFILCKTNLCLNNGICFQHLSTGARQCFCSNNYGGPYCEKKCDNC